MEEVIREQEQLLRVGLFLGIFCVMALWEWFGPRRRLHLARRRRWGANIGIVVIDTLVLRIVFPAAALGAALMADRYNWGLLQQVSLPPVAAVPLSIILLDLLVYAQHVLVHYVPLLWRFHRVHHADLDFDVTTGFRFHPVEILFSMALKSVFILLLGPPLLAVLLFEMILSSTSLFNHSNVRLPVTIDRWLRWIVVTPDMHRVHHSVVRRETNSNFGFNLPWWDRLFGTYRAQPQAGHRDMQIGLVEYRDPDVAAGLPGMLAMPFKSA